MQPVMTLYRRTQSMLTPTRQRVFDPMTFLWDQYDSAPRSHAYTATTPEEHVKWEQELREKVIELLGGFPTEDIPLVPEIVEEREFPDYIRQRVIFESRPNMSIPAYLLLPKNTTGKIPGIVCLSGHGPGNHTIVGYDDDGNPRDELDFPDPLLSAVGTCNERSGVLAPKSLMTAWYLAW